MRIAVEGKQTSGGESTTRQAVVEVLPRRIAIDLDGNSSTRGHREHAVPFSMHPGARSGDPSTGMRQYAHTFVFDRCDHARGLVLRPAQPRMWCGKHHIEGGRLLDTQIERAGRIDIRLDTLQQPKW